MKKLLSKKVAKIMLITSLIVLMALHLLVVIKILPGDIVWGGTVEEDSVVTYEIVACFITGILLFFAVVKAGYINNKTLKKIADVFIWIMSVYFAFMIMANLAAKNLTEKIIFIPLSILMFVASFRLAVEKD